MRLESKIINALYDAVQVPSQVLVEQNVQSTQPEQYKHFSFRELKKTSRDLMLLTSDNLNSLFKAQGSNVRIDSSRFIDFVFSSSSLMATYKAIFIDSDDNKYENSVFVSWNGDKVNIC